MKLSHQVVQRQVVAFGTKAADHGQGEVGEVGLMSKGFATVDVADVDFDKGKGHSGQRVSQGDAGVGKGGRVHDKTGYLSIWCAVDQIDQGPFVVALVALNRKAFGLAQLNKGLVDLLEGGGAVDLRLSKSKPVEVGSV